MNGEALTSPARNADFGDDALPPLIYAYGMSLRKLRILRAFVTPIRVSYLRGITSLPSKSILLVWGSKNLTAMGGISVVRVEDGFIRSIGLGADLIWPISWVFDQRGMYYDARQESDLEHLLQNTQFDDDLLYRARQLRKKIVAHGLSKYNLSAANWNRPPSIEKVVLVVGQVESDASIQCGSANIKTNLDLLKAVRLANPKAYIVYKSHPDVVAGLRASDQHREQLNHYYDEGIEHVSIQSVLDNVDAVYVITSLTGFEALIRHIPVFCYGHPFYAGWGLTSDLAPPIPRRSRVLTLDELVAASLILYPRYMSLSSRKPLSVEQALDELITLRNQQLPTPWWRKLLRTVLQQFGKNR